MAKFRYPLQNQLWNAFVRTIREDYEEQLINSENGMLAAFDRHLRLEIPKARRIFIEPRVFDAKDATRRWFPDMVVCNSREVIAVLEMKYTPRGYPKYERDVEKLKSVAKLRKRLHVANTRYLGVPIDDRQYLFSPKTVFVWVGVHRSFPGCDNSEVPRLVKGNSNFTNSFIQFHGITAANEKPEMIWALG